MLLATAVVARAQEATFPPGALTEALKARIGKPVVLYLTSGMQVGGTLAEVRDFTVVVKGITPGREFSDAMIRLDLVAGVEVRRQQP